MLLLSSADFFKINFFKRFFRELNHSVKLFGSRSVGPDLGPNCLQRLSADGNSHHKQHEQDNDQNTRYSGPRF